jgi:hypothetical protein
VPMLELNNCEEFECVFAAIIRWRFFVKVLLLPIFESSRGSD